jgi:hypothetical protein
MAQEELFLGQPAFSCRSIVSTTIHVMVIDLHSLVGGLTASGMVPFMTEEDEIRMLENCRYLKPLHDMSVELVFKLLLPRARSVSTNGPSTGQFHGFST